MLNLIVLLFSVLLGLLFFFQARWLIRLLLGRHEKQERRAALSFGIFGALLIPLAYGTGLIEGAVSGSLGKILSTGLVVAAVCLFLGGPFFMLGMKESRRQ
ncbi:MAG: hypothetical protein WAL45_03785 [Terracidiphilus sp.]